MPTKSKHGVGDNGRDERGQDEQGKTPKPRKRRKDARPAELVAAGLAEFAEKGFAATRLEDVAARAGVVKGTIYRYFDSKDALFREALVVRVAPILDELSARVDASEEPTEDLLIALLTTIYDRFVGSDLKVLVRLIVAESPRFPDLAAHYHAEVVTRGERLLRMILARGVVRGEFRASSVEAYPVVIVAPAIAAAIWQMTFSKQAQLELHRYRDAHVDLILNGLKSHAE